MELPNISDIISYILLALGFILQLIVKRSSSTSSKITRLFVKERIDEIKNQTTQATQECKQESEKLLQESASNLTNTLNQFKSNEFQVLANEINTLKATILDLKQQVKASTETEDKLKLVITELLKED